MSVVKPTISLFKYQKKKFSQMSSMHCTSVATKELRFSKPDREFRFAVATACTTLKMLK